MTTTPIAYAGFLSDGKISDTAAGIYATNKRTRNFLFNTSNVFLILHGDRIQSDNTIFRLFNYKNWPLNITVYDGSSKKYSSDLVSLYNVEVAEKL